MSIGAFGGSADRFSEPSVMPVGTYQVGTVT